MDGSGTRYSLPFDLMPHKPNKFRKLNQLSVSKQVIRTSPYVKPAFGACTEARMIRDLIREIEFTKSHPVGSKVNKDYLESLDVFHDEPTTKAALKAKGLI